MMKLTSLKMNNLDRIYGITAYALMLGLGVYAGFKALDDRATRRTAWKQTACPSLLSIGRSSRDTLIIMKNLPDCNRFVLDNLK